MSVADQYDATARIASGRAGAAAETAIQIRMAVASLPSSFATIEQRHTVATWHSRAAGRSRAELIRISRLTGVAHHQAIELARRLDAHAADLDRQAAAARSNAQVERRREAAERADEAAAAAGAS